MTNPQDTNIDTESRSPLGGAQQATKVGDGTKKRGTSRWKLYTRRFFRNKLATVGLLILLGLIFLSTIGGYFTQWDYYERRRQARSTGSARTMPVMTFTRRWFMVLGVR